MSERWPGGIVRSTPVTPTGPYQTGTAPGVWTMADAAYWIKQNLWPIAGNAAIGYIGVLSGGGTAEEGRKIVIDSSGNVYAAISEVSIGSYYSPYLAKFNSDGDLQWQRQAPFSTANSTNWGLVLDGSANPYLVGYTREPGGNPRGLVIKYSSTGSLTWENYYTLGSSDTTLFSGSVYSSDMIFGGQTNNQFSGYTGYFFLRTSTSGTFTSSRVFGNSSSQGDYYTNDITASAAGAGSSIWIVGYFFGSGRGYASIAKLNSSLSITYNQTLSESTSFHAFTACISDSSDNLHVCGYAGSSAMLVKFNASGTILWQKKLTPGSGSAAFYGVSLDASGNVYAAGQVGNDILIAKYDSSGVLQWQRTLGSTAGTDYAQTIAVNSAGTRMFIGGAGAVNGTNETLIIKLPTDGTGTGSYTVSSTTFVYASSSLTGGDTALSNAGFGLSSATVTATQNTASNTDAAGTLTYARTFV